MAPPHFVGLGRPRVGSSTHYTNDSWSDRQGELADPILGCGYAAAGRTV
jgi:hypothetical protein